MTHLASGNVVHVGAGDPRLAKHQKAHETHDALSTRESAAAGARLAGKRILLVEDEPGIRGLLQRMLTRAGCEVITACNGRDALEVAALENLKDLAAPIDLVIADVVMPEMGGVELAQELRREKPDLRVLLIGGQVGLVNVPPGAPFLMKPFTVATLLGAVQGVLTAGPKTRTQIRREKRKRAEALRAALAGIRYRRGQTRDLPDLTDEELRQTADGEFFRWIEEEAARRQETVSVLSNGPDGKWELFANGCLAVTLRGAVILEVRRQRDERKLDAAMAAAQKHEALPE